MKFSINVHLSESLRRGLRLATLLRPASLAVMAVMAVMAEPAAAQQAEKGKAAYVQHGCWQCHGFVGQGGVAGPKLAPEAKPLEYFAAFIRNTRGAMPPYSETLLSKQDLADIHAYLKALPRGPEAASIPLLN